MRLWQGWFPGLMAALLLIGAAGCDSEAVSETSAEANVFRQVAEPNESAFTLLVPQEWTVRGGIQRVDPTAAGGPAQSVAAKLDFAVVEPSSVAMIRWLPDVLFFDASMSPAGQMGMFPPGSNYRGMTVYPKMSASQFIVDIAFPYAHPEATEVEVVSSESLADLARRYTERTRAAIPMIDFSHDAAVVTFSYTENGRRISERMMAVVEDYGQMGAGLWGNKETVLIRAGQGQLGSYEKYFSVIQGSVRINQQWLLGEIRGQAQRSQIMRDTQREIQRIGEEIAEHRRQTNAEINNDMFLTLTGQEEYVNPYTNEVEVGSNQWRHRWVNESGDVIYTDVEDYDPNIDINLSRSDFKRTPIRKRFGEE